MPRNHKRKPATRRYADYTEETLAEALSVIKSKSMSLRETSKKYKISLGTLSRKLKKKNMNKYGRPTVLTEQEEQKIVEGLQVVGEWGFPLTTTDLQLVVQSYLDSCGRSERRFTQNRPGRDWVFHFRNRHPELSNRLAENIKRSRAEVSEETITRYFENLGSALDGLPPDKIINYDESNLSDDPGRSKVLVRKGTKHSERCLDSSKMSTSIMVACSASGILLPPYIIYKAEHLYDSWTERGPKGARYNRTKSGWMDARVFEDWFDSIIIPHFKKLDPGPKALIGDNLSSHISQNVIEKCRENNIRFILLPPNSTHLCQPLDVAFFRPMKAAWRKQLLEWKLSNKGGIPKAQFPSLLRKTLDKLSDSQTQIIQSGFRATGIYPLDRTQVLKRLPGGKEVLKETVLTEALTGHLRQMRYGKENKQPDKKKKRLMVEPGQSISGHNKNSDESDESETEISLHDSNSSIGEEMFSDDSEEGKTIGETENTSREEVVSEPENKSSDEPIEETSDNRNEQNNAPAKSINGIESDGDIVVDSFVLICYNGTYFPGKVLSINNEIYSVKHMTRYGKYGWRWPDREDILDYQLDEIHRRIPQPRLINKRGTYVCPSVEELNEQQD